MASPRPFRIAVPDETLDRIYARVADYAWHEMPDDGGWAYGANLDYMKELCAYWLSEFDWRSQEAALNRFPHFIAPVEGIDIHTASWIYYGRREEGGRVLSPEGRRVEVPTGCALFPAEFLSWPPRSYVERVYNVTHWTEMPRGGHFAALEQPELFVEDLRAFARSLRLPGRPPL